LQPRRFERFSLEPGVESCITLFARNVFTNEEVQRTVCVTGAEPPEGRAPRPAPRPPLQDCAKPPKADGVIAEGYVDPWCEARADACLDPSTEGLWKNDCTSFRDHCDVEALREAMNEGDDSDDDDGSSAAPPSMADDRPDTDGANTGESRMCSVQAPGLGSHGYGPWVSLAGIGLASIWLRRKRRP
jgi:hypothetical protein